jgi:hypothetical protein
MGFSPERNRRLARCRPEPHTIVFPWRIVRRHPHRGPVEQMDQGYVQSRQARAGAAERARIRPAALVRLAPIHEGQSILEVARQAGHSRHTCLRDYGHLFAEFDPARPEPAEAVIAAARASSYPSRTFRQTRTGANPLVEQKPPTAGCPRAGTSGPCRLPMAARPRAGTGGAARARCRAPARLVRARTGSTRRA